MSAILFQHSFRDEAPKKAQVKIKCTSCGCWATRGGKCYHCGARVEAAPPGSRSASEAISRSPSHIGTTRQHRSFREEAAGKTQEKIKCTSCGRWAPRGGQCYHCKARSSSSPPSSRSAAEGIARSPTSPTRPTPPMNHVFREESSKTRQVKIKCTSCGCWAKRGGNCYFCHKPAELFPPSAMSAAESITRPPSGMSASPSQSFREESAKGPQLKVKCSSCGCWATRGGSCYFCRSPVAAFPPSATSAADALTRSPSGWSLTSDPCLFRSIKSQSAPCNPDRKSVV